MTATENKVYDEFVRFYQERGHPLSLTGGEYEFARQLTELIEDYPSLRNKLESVGSRTEVFRKLEYFFKERVK